jgi:thioredoxin 1
MMLFQDGKQLWRQSGVLTKEEIIKIILDKTNSNEQQNLSTKI